MALMNCPECNREISDRARSCPGCGYPVTEAPSTLTRTAPPETSAGPSRANGKVDGRESEVLMRFETEKKSFAVGILLWLFLGTLGAHRFYLGREGSAIMIPALLLTSVAFLGVAEPGTAAEFFGGLGILVTAGWIVVDAFQVSGWVREHNENLIHSIRDERQSSTMPNAVKQEPRPLRGPVVVANCPSCDNVEHVPKSDGCVASSYAKFRVEEGFLSSRWLLNCKVCGSAFRFDPLRAPVESSPPGGVLGGAGP